MELMDTHAHLDLPEFARDLADVLQRAAQAGVGRIICVGTTLESSRQCVELARRFPGRIYASAGIHPNHCGEAASDDLDGIKHLARLSEVVAIGETGLDLHHTYAPPELQEQYLQEHVRLAVTVGKPLIIHARRADTQLLRVLREEAEAVHGVRHCFDGTPDAAADYLELGMHVAFGGILTRAGYNRVKQAAGVVPATRLLVETDCPYMTPPGAGTARNEPAFIVHTVQALAALRRTSAEEIASITTHNALRLFFTSR